MYLDPKTSFERVLYCVCTIEEREISIRIVLCEKYMLYRCANFKVDHSG